MEWFASPLTLTSAVVSVAAPYAIALWLIGMAGVVFARYLADLLDRSLQYVRYWAYGTIGLATAVIALGFGVRAAAALILPAVLTSVGMFYFDAFAERQDDEEAEKRSARFMRNLDKMLPDRAAERKALEQAQEGPEDEEDGL